MRKSSRFVITAFVGLLGRVSAVVVALCAIGGVIAAGGMSASTGAWPSAQLVGLRVTLTFSAELSSNQCPATVGASPTMTTVSASLSGQASAGGWSFVPWSTPQPFNPDGEIYFPSQAYSGQMDHVIGFLMNLNVTGPGYPPGQLMLNVRGGGTNLCSKDTAPLPTEQSPLGAAYPIKWGLAGGSIAYGAGCGYVALTGAPYDFYHPTPFTETLLLTDSTTADSIVGKGFDGFDCVAGHAVVKTAPPPPSKTTTTPTTSPTPRHLPKCTKAHPRPTKAHPCRKG